MVIDSVAATNTTRLRTQQAIDGVTGQILPDGLGGIGSGFVESPAIKKEFAKNWPPL
jgi:hypothetical protein